MAVESKDLELFHYGVKGMKWGVRRKVGSDGLVEGKPPGRFARGMMRRNERQAKLHEAVKTGKGGKVLTALSAPDKIIMGKKNFEKYHDMHISALRDQNERIRTGKTTVADKIDIAFNTPLIDVIRA